MERLSGAAHIVSIWLGIAVALISVFGASIGGGIWVGGLQKEIEQNTQIRMEVRALISEIRVLETQTKSLSELIQKDLDHMNDRMDQHDDRTENITARLRDVERAVPRASAKR